MAKVLIVDDQRDVSRLLKSALETIEQGLNVYEAPSGEEAILEASSRVKVDLLIADYRLPGISGLELMNKFRARNPDVKVILITGISEPRLRDEVSKSGADAYFFKPVPMSEFLAAVEQLLGLTPTVVPASAAPATKPAPEPEERNTLADQIANLRKALDAKSVILLDSLGHVQAEAGDLPDPNKSASLISALMGLNSASQKVGGLLGRIDGGLNVFGGTEFDAVFMPVGTSHTLLVVGKGLSSTEALPRTRTVIQPVRDEIFENLQKMGKAGSLDMLVVEEMSAAAATTAPVAESLASAPAPAAPQPAPVVEEVSDDFLALFSGGGAAAAPKKDSASDFWDTLVENGTTYAEPDKLTYEQASRLGLTPGGDS